MQETDIAFKYLNRHGGHAMTQELGGVPCDRLKPIEGEVQAVTRLEDRAFIATHDKEKFVVYMEAYTRWDKSRGSPSSV